MKKTAKKLLDLTSNPVRRAKKITGRLRDLIALLRHDIEGVAEPKAQALFETSAEVLTGLVTAFEDYGKKREQAWRTAFSAGRR
jgi:hypothetical protein